MNLKSSLWVLGLCFAAPASAAAQTVYFSAGTEIRTVSAAGGSTALVHTSPTSSVGDLALCAGNPTAPLSAAKQYLYFVERDAIGGDRISRLDVKTPLGKKGLANISAETLFTVSPASGRVGEIRLTTECDVIFATSMGGVFQVDGEAPSTAATAIPNTATSAGSALAVAFDGSLRYSDGGELKSSLTGFPTTSVAPAVIVGAGVANGGAGSVATTLPTPTAVGPVCVSTANTIKCTAKAGGSFATDPFASFAVSGSTAVNNAQFFEFLTNDIAVAATSVDPNAGLGGQAKFNGILWRVGPSGVTELARGAKVNGVFVPIVGVAVGPSAASAPLNTVVGQLQSVNFGPVTFRVETPEACSLTITLRQLSWSDAHAKLSSVNGSLSPAKYLLDRGLGGESWVDDVDVAVAPNSDCGLAGSPRAFVFIAQYLDNAPSRAVLHCTGNVCQIATHGNFPYSQPDDEGDSALPDNFSDFLTAQISSVSAPIVFSSPLNNLAVVDGAIDQEIAAASTHNASGGLSLRFRICDNTACTTFKPAEVPNPPTTGAGLSVTRLTDNGLPLADCNVIDQGSSTPDLPVFRTTDPDGVTHNFNLNTPIEGPSECQLSDKLNGQSGLFVATVFSHGGTFTKTSILFKLIK